LLMEQGKLKKGMKRNATNTPEGGRCSLGAKKTERMRICFAKWLNYWIEWTKRISQARSFDSTRKVTFIDREQEKGGRSVGGRN